MTVPQVDIDHFTIATQVETINEIANLEGDLTTLETDSKDNLVDAINEVRDSIVANKRTILTYSIAMS
jgi:3-dehydroquinate dehydratase